MVTNIDVREKEGYVIVSVGTKVYLPEAVYAAAYALMDKHYVYVTGDPERILFVLLKPKYEVSGEELERAGLEFNNYLLSFQVYYTHAAYINQIRQSIISQAVGGPVFPQEERPPVPPEVIDSFDSSKESPEEDLIVEDPEGIAVPWEKKYGKGDKERADS